MALSTTTLLLHTLHQLLRLGESATEAAADDLEDAAVKLSDLTTIPYRSVQMVWRMNSQPPLLMPIPSHFF
jgi:hypothetical protein